LDYFCRGLLIVSTLILTSCASTQRDKRLSSEQNRIFISPNVEYSVSEASDATQDLRRRSDGRKPILLFIHGRGAGEIPHPEKSLTLIFAMFCWRLVQLNDQIQQVISNSLFSVTAWALALLKKHLIFIAKPYR